MPYLRIYAGDRLLEQYELKAARTTIGRADDNDVVLSERGVSKHHAFIERIADGHLFRDNDSVNGSFVGDDRVHSRRLRFWDEIRISGYRLRFMAKARLPGEEAPAARPVDPRDRQEVTIELDAARLGDLARLARRRQVATLVLAGGADGSDSIELQGVEHLMGRGQEIDIGGWLSPRTAARIERRPDGFFLCPGWRGRARINGFRVKSPMLLRDGDQLEVAGARMRFLYRFVEDGA